MAKKTKTVKDLNSEVEILAEKYRNLEEKVEEKDRKIEVMKIVIKRNEKHIVKLEKMLTENKTKPKKSESQF